jgi:hypothetical protein
MIVYDVIAMVAPDARTSDPKGSYSIRHFDDEAKANACAARCNECCTVRGIAYTVMAIDELSPERYPTLDMIRHGEAEPIYSKWDQSRSDSLVALEQEAL